MTVVKSAALAAAFVVLVASGGLVPSARAATVEASDGTVVFRAGPGEANDVTVTTTRTASDFGVTVTDAGAPLAAGPGCDQLANAVACPHARSLIVWAGNRDDHVGLSDRVGFGYTAIYGEQGDDSLNVSSSVGMSPLLVGGRGDDTLTAHMNSGRDVPILHGGRGSDSLQLEDIAAGEAFGGPGDDRILYDGTPRAPAPLVLEGDVGDDTYSFGFLTAQHGFTAALAAIVSGPGFDTLDQSGETSSVPALDLNLSDCAGCVERVIGTPFDDHITGDARAQVILGGPGNDVIDGEGGSDLLGGGDGDDTITSSDGVFDAVGCGDGIDSVVADRFDFVSPSCETVSRESMRRGR
jgi:Ca2+-binding RTX toxin-like protein